MPSLNSLESEHKKLQSLKQQSAWLFAAKVVGFGFSFVLPLIIVRSLAKEQVGDYREAFQIITNAAIVLPLGFSMSAYYFLSRETERRRAAILNILLFNFIVGGFAALVLFLFPNLLPAVLRNPILGTLSPIIGVVIWISIFSLFLETAALANSEARAATVFIVFSAFSKTLLMGGAVFLFGSVEAFLYAAIVQGLIQTFILIGYLRSRFPGFWRAFDRKFLLEQGKYAIPFGLTAVLWIAQIDIHNYFAMYKFSSAEFAVYAYGCFQMPLIAMLSESVTSVLIPRMNTLQQNGDREEMIRLTARAMQKLALVYFPLYVFLMITATTFITTLFTREYLESAPIFMINLTIVPFGVIVTDPVVRSYRELGRFFLLTRVFVLTLLIGVLYFALGQLGPVGIISVAVGAILLEKLIGETMVIRKLGIGIQHLYLLKNVGKTAVVSLAAGIVTWLFYSGIQVDVAKAGERFAYEMLGTNKSSTIDFLSGGLVLLVSALVFAPVYLLAANFWGVIEKNEKEAVTRQLKRILPKWVMTAAPNSQG